MCDALFEFHVPTYTVEPIMGFVHMISHVYFNIPETMFPDDVGEEQGFAMSFDKHDKIDDFVLGGIKNIYWNDTFAIPAAALNFIQANFASLIKQAEYELANNVYEKRPRPRSELNC